MLIIKLIDSIINFQRVGATCYGNKSTALARQPWKENRVGWIDSRIIENYFRRGCGGALIWCVNELESHYARSSRLVSPGWRVARVCVSGSINQRLSYTALRIIMKRWSARAHVAFSINSSTCKYSFRRRNERNWHLKIQATKMNVARLESVARYF